MLTWHAHQASEAASEEQMAEAAMGVLRRVFGAAIPNPVAAVASKWGSDPYAKGAAPIIIVHSLEQSCCWCPRHHWNRVIHAP